MLRDDLIDPILLERIGDMGQGTRYALIEVCTDALIAMTGRGIAEEIMENTELARRCAPWLWDLARGLHYQYVFGSVRPTTGELIENLAAYEIPLHQLDVLIDRVDWAYLLTEARVEAYIKSGRETQQDRTHRESNYPWYGRLLVGYHISLAIEALRLAQFNS